MSWRSARGNTNEELVRNLRAKKIICSDNVEKAMIRTDRGYYTNFARYADVPHAIGYGVTMSSPHMYANILECLKNHLIPGESALDVGCGSGYLTACMALMVGRKGKAVGIDHIPELINLAKLNVRKDNPNLLKSKRIKFIVGDGRIGHTEIGPYNAIYVGAAVQELPEPLLLQLKLGGRLIIPMGPKKGIKHMMKIDKSMDGTITKEKLLSFSYLPDREKRQQWPSDFNTICTTKN